jgi:hypothetical protein
MTAMLGATLIMEPLIAMHQDIIADLTIMLAARLIMALQAILLINPFLLMVTIIMQALSMETTHIVKNTMMDMAWEQVRTSM